MQAWLQFCGHVASGRSQHRHPSARLQGNDKRWQLLGSEEQWGPLPAQWELHSVCWGKGHHCEGQPAALQWHSRSFGDLAGYEALRRSPDCGGAVCRPDDASSHSLLLLPCPSDQRGKDSQKRWACKLPQQCPCWGYCQGEGWRWPEEVLQQGESRSWEMDISTLGHMLSDLRQWEPKEAGTVSQTGREARVGLRSFPKTLSHQGLWRSMSRVAHWAMVSLLPNLWEGLQETTIALQNRSRASAPKGPLHWLTEATGAGLL